MLVSFVQAGLMRFAQSLGVILGADIGTTVTALTEGPRLSVTSDAGAGEIAARLPQAPPSRGEALDRILDDYRSLVDAGADPVFDFIDAGYVSTYHAHRDVLHDIVMTLGAQMAAAEPDIIIVEVADGLLQRETARLFATPAFTDWIDGIIFAANDALGAQAGISWLSARQLPVFAITGVLTSSPLARREAEDICGLPVYHTGALARPSVSSYIYQCLEFRRRNRMTSAGKGS